MTFIPKDPGAILRQEKSKYRNRKVRAFGKTFDSVLERDRYFYLLSAEKRGEIRNLKTQVKFKLGVTSYRADFVYEKLDAMAIHRRGVPGREWYGPVIEDTKGGYKLPADFRIKQKMMAERGTPIRIVKEPTEAI